MTDIEREALIRRARALVLLGRLTDGVKLYRDVTGVTLNEARLWSLDVRSLKEQVVMSPFTGERITQIVDR